MLRGGPGKTCPRSCLSIFSPQPPTAICAPAGEETRFHNVAVERISRGPPIQRLQDPKIAAKSMWSSAERTSALCTRIFPPSKQSGHTLQAVV